ncbi:MAG TPA: LysE family transporter [Burkholderiaceae bacterium]|nr:LysE family transporter [Burkholderiaceae bacterium]
METAFALPFLQSVLIGLSIAAPVGPIGLLTIQRSIERGPAAGLATGLGAAFADGIYGALGALGLAALVHALVSARLWLTLGGVAFMLALAWRTWRMPPAHGLADERRGADILRCFSTTFVLTLSNPMTILSFIAVFGSMSTHFAKTSPWTMIAGVFLGSALWWLLLSTAVGKLGQRFDSRRRRQVSRASAILLAVLAVWQLALLLRP